MGQCAQLLKQGPGPHRRRMVGTVWPLLHPVPLDSFRVARGPDHTGGQSSALWEVLEALFS